jgi:Uma2 family endonuclease
MADSAQPIRVYITYSDYYEFPDDGKRYEVIEGELSMNPAPNIAHQRISRNLFLILHHHNENKKLGEIFYAPVDVILTDMNIVQPDLAFISRERHSIIEQRGIFGAPDLIVEIISPGTSRTDRLSKFQIYGRYGVTWYWIIDPAGKSLEEYLLQGDGYVAGARVSGNECFHPGIFSDLEIFLSSLWPEDL